jgi:hypothetical protein
MHCAGSYHNNGNKTVPSCGYPQWRLMLMPVLMRWPLYAQADNDK